MNAKLEENKELDTILSNLKTWKTELQGFQQELESSTKNLNTILRSIRKLPKNAYIIDSLITEILSSKNSLPNFDNNEKYLQKLKDFVSKEKIRFEIDFYKILKETFTSEGIKLEGNPPVLIAKPFQITFDMNNGTATLLLGREIVSSSIPLDPKKILNKYKKHHRLICERKFDPQIFISNLFKSYNRVLRLKSLPGNSKHKVNIIDVLNEYVFIIQSSKFHRSHKKEDFRSYPRSYFLYDIYRLQMSQTLKFEKYKLSFTSATIDTTGKSDKMLYLPDMQGDTRPVMAIEFIEVDR